MDQNEQADKDFTRARRMAFLRRIGAYLRNDSASNQLLSFEEVRSVIGAVQQHYAGMRVVPVSKIVGSVGRHRDFDRSFLPARASVAGRWKKIDQAMMRAEELPPVSLYKIGDAYFVRDGNHRVSVARRQGIEMIDAEVTELKSRVPVDENLTVRDLLHKLEQRRFLERLPMDRVLPEIELRFSDAADYGTLATYIEAHGFRLSQLWRRYVSHEEVLRDWYEYSYRPISAMIREERVLDAFPGRTELDLYAWIIRHRERLVLEWRRESVTPENAMDDILQREGERRRNPLDPERLNIYEG
ncbi:transcriptional regulator [Rubrobacter marinus]|uniref:Transcriptional regulator n=1 Tax=Rubrobacter marinus TaxID=2653852 RepID=A0A6G8Q1R1_9ACTN|nr:transcriptional regulator [Rubrobacter marinus]QIN80388.1 transcriptional regulator [Rubrobacter marinus]